ncbi:MAG: Gfo/Idh/MocA family oxidoreductase [Planctomycetota bacterium]
MPDPIRVAIIGLDTSHAVEYPRRMQAPDCAEELRVPGLRAVSCLRFPSAFQNESGQDQRQAQLVNWGVRVAPDITDALRDVDAVMLEINDPTLHLPWFAQVVALGKPVYIDKPLADSAQAGAEIIRLATAHRLRLFSSSPLRSDATLNITCAALPRPHQVAVYGPLGTAPTGSSVLWYGVHAVEMLNRAMGRGAAAVSARRDACGVTLIVDYLEQRRGVVELTAGVWIYGGTLRDNTTARTFSVDSAAIYSAHLRDIERFFRGGEPLASLDDALEILRILAAADRSLASGHSETIQP